MYFEFLIYKTNKIKSYKIILERNYLERIFYLEFNPFKSNFLNNLNEILKNHLVLLKNKVYSIVLIKSHNNNLYNLNKSLD